MMGLLSSSIVVPPCSGLGDLLYAGLFLRSLVKHYPYRPVVFSSPKQAWLCDILNVKHCSSSSLFCSRMQRGQLMQELAFWAGCWRNEGAFVVSTTNDIFDAALAWLFKWERLTPHVLGNFYKLSHPGRRGAINNIFRYRYGNELPNPKHILARQLFYLEHIGISNSSDLLAAYMDEWQSRLKSIGIENEVPSRNVVIFADAGSYERELTVEQLKRLCKLYAGENAVTIVTSRSIECPELLKYKCKSILSTTDGFAIAAGASQIISTDSFPAHFSAMMGKPLSIIYNSPKIPIYAEWWGIPDSKTKHFENGMMFTIDENFRAVALNPKGIDLDVAEVSTLGV
jgi:hypothetical protein